MDMQTLSRVMRLIGAMTDQLSPEQCEAVAQKFEQDEDKFFQETAAGLRKMAQELRDEARDDA